MKMKIAIALVMVCFFFFFLFFVVVVTDRVNFSFGKGKKIERLLVDLMERSPVRFTLCLQQGLRCLILLALKETPRSTELLQQ